MYPFVGYGRSSCGDFLFWDPDFVEGSLGRGSSAEVSGHLHRLLAAWAMDDCGGLG